MFPRVSYQYQMNCNSVSLVSYLIMVISLCVSGIDTFVSMFKFSINYMCKGQWCLGVELLTMSAVLIPDVLYMKVRLRVTRVWGPARSVVRILVICRLYVITCKLDLQCPGFEWPTRSAVRIPGQCLPFGILPNYLISYRHHSNR